MFTLKIVHTATFCPIWTFIDNAISLFDILHNLFPFMAARLELLADELDSPANGMMLEPTLHGELDMFVFCLIPWVRSFWIIGKTVLKPSSPGMLRSRTRINLRFSEVVLVH